MDTHELEAADYRSIDEDGVVFIPSHPWINNQRFCLTDIKGFVVILTPWYMILNLFPVLHLIVVGPSTTVVSLENFRMKLAWCLAVQSCVYREQNKGLRHTALRAVALAVRVEEIL